MHGYGCHNVHVDSLVAPIAKQHQVVIDSSDTHRTQLALYTLPLVIRLAAIPQTVVELKTRLVSAVATEVARQEIFGTLNLTTERTVPAAWMDEEVSSRIRVPGTQVGWFRVYVVQPITLQKEP